MIKLVAQGERVLKEDQGVIQESHQNHQVRAKFRQVHLEPILLISQPMACNHNYFLSSQSIQSLRMNSREVGCHR
jgi:hypothetical protein